MEFKRVKVNDLRTLDQLCIGKTAEQLQAMARVVHQWRLKLREEKDALERNQHRCGDEVSFRTRKDVLVTGIVKSVNKRTLSLHRCSDGGKWKVAYCFIEKTIQ